MFRRVFLAAACCAMAVPAEAQLPKPLPVAVADVRLFYGAFGQDPVTAADLETRLMRPVAATLLPKRGPGGALGIHVYALRGKKIALGFGGEGILMQARAAETDATGALTGFVVRQRLQGLSGQLSLNFGHRDGWSYLTAGMGPLAFYTYEGDVRPTDPPPAKMTLNLGAGARWFATGHVAFGFDIRFYQTKPDEGTPSYPGRQRSNLRILSAGISIR